MKKETSTRIGAAMLVAPILALVVWGIVALPGPVLIALAVVAWLNGAFYFLNRGF